ncbi:hypothetical protein V3C99_001063 [Haemonchus contortus]
MIGKGVGVGTLEIHTDSVHGGFGIGRGTGSRSVEIYNASNPTKINIPNFDNGKRLRFVIVPTKKASQFQINLCTPSDIALHFNPRLNENIIVFNTTRGGNWMHEERIIKSFHTEKVYTLEFISNHGRIQVLLNGTVLYEFAERLPSSHINSVEIGGDVHVHSVQFF